MNVFIIDDTLFNRTSCKKTELGSKVFDHVEMKFRKGFRLLTLGWSDGNTFLPVNSCLLASSKESNIIGPTKEFDKRSIAGKRRKLAQMKAPDAMMHLIDAAVTSGISADYVLFDCWFANPAQITALKAKNLDVSVSVIIEVLKMLRNSKYRIIQKKKTKTIFLIIVQTASLFPDSSSCTPSPIPIIPTQSDFILINSRMVLFPFYKPINICIYLTPKHL